MLHERNQHLRKTLWIADLILHMVIPFKHREIAAGIGTLHRGAVLVMRRAAAEGKICPALQLLRQRRKGSVLQTVRKLAAQIAVGQRLPRRDEIGPDGRIITPEQPFQCFPVGPVEALKRQI